ncbi:uncharacterized protein BJ212DRAFT_1308035 [Suillus subaureus]|uniref:Uncharacterized protein n=1 Tax=Suillus subaureus TaxID=48587 RepID=A0A9P7JJY0_9AGAM|nr:uncharacterized protein BJ212DRAFT_1308035 [Suillus subaureus]KAG1826752.1 hypothetical protein BJ212DRAFT_1308035 [Suillus subaureus]
MILFISFMFPYTILVLPSILGFQSYGYRIMFTLSALGVTILIANLYYWFSAVSHYLGGLQHDWGCASQLFNWVTILPYLIVIMLFDAEISAFSITSTLIALILLFPVLEFPFWILVGSGKNKDHLHVYGKIHDWITVEVGGLLMLLVTGVLDLVLNLVKQASEWVNQATNLVVEVIIAVRNFLPRLNQPPNQQLETAGTEQPPPYLGSTIHFWHRPINQIYKQFDFHSHSVSSSSSSDVIAEGAAKV